MTYSKITLDGFDVCLAALFSAIENGRTLGLADRRML